MKASITIRDVARTAEVSVGTASRVINGKATVGAEVRDRVLKAIETLGYHPDAIAQSMRRGSTHVIGCVIRDINIPSLAAFVHAAHNVLDRAGFSLLVSNSEGREDRERELLTRLNSQRSDGIMIGPGETRTITLKGDVAAATDAKVHYQTLNDFGGAVSGDAALAQGSDPASR